MARASSPMSDAQHRTLVRKAIAHAETVAADDDAAFVRALRTHFFTQHAQRARALRVVAGGRRRGPAADPSFHIFQDPRFLRNARELARRTQRGVRVIGGATVKAKDFLDCVAVGNDQQWGCTGTLVARNVVLTAGHCASFATRVFFGRDVSKTGTVVGVRRRVRHPDYHKKGKHNDLMVLVLEFPVPSVPPRRLASSAARSRARRTASSMDATRPSS